MSNKKPSVTKDQLLFGGAIGASLSHEINNVFATIGELNGLLEDLVNFRSDDCGIDPERVANITGRIQNEVLRGKVLGKQLNRFSHSVEGTTRHLNVSEIINNVADLCGRLARLRKVKIETKASDEDLFVEANLYDLQHLVFRCLELALFIAKEDTAIKVAILKAGEDIRFEFSSGLPRVLNEEAALKVDALRTITKKSAGTIEMDFNQMRPMTIRLILSCA